MCVVGIFRWKKIRRKSRILEVRGLVIFGRVDWKFIRVFNVSIRRFVSDLVDAE